MVIKLVQTVRASLIVFASKDHGSLPSCVNYRTLNTRTKRDSYPASCMNQFIDSLKVSAVLSTLITIVVYCQAKDEKNYHDKTAFTSFFELYRFVRVTFGLEYGPGTFGLAIDVILAAVQWQFALVYLKT